MITAEYVRDVLDYSPDTGIMIWKMRTDESFLRSNYGRTWNTRFAGKAVGCVNKNGYKHVNLAGKNRSIHRLVWAHYYGRFPNSDIDHANGNKLDNRIANLRLCNDSQNQANAKVPTRNTSGVKGVCWAKDTKKWQAQITWGGRQLYLGQFYKLKDAAAARAQAEKGIFGEFTPKC